MKKCIAASLCCLIAAGLASATLAAGRGLQTRDSRPQTQGSGVQTQDSRLETSDWFAVVSSESAALYERMTANAAAIQKVTKGYSLRIEMEFTGEAGHWFKVSTVGPVASVGYVKAEDLSVPSPPDTAAWEYKPPPDPSPESAAEGARLKAGRVLIPVTRAEIEKDVRAFFASRFRHGAPISADGQTTFHSRMGFDHSNAVDIALGPDSAEGQALMTHLRAMGIPFIAFRRAVPGSATGAHIHVGIPSPRYRRLR